MAERIPKNKKNGHETAEKIIAEAIEMKKNRTE